MNLRARDYVVIFVVSFAFTYTGDKSEAQQIRREQSPQRFRYTIRPNVRNEIVLRVIPHAICVVRGKNSEGVEFLSESEGYGHFFITAPEARVDPIVLQVICSEAVGKKSYALDLYSNDTPAQDRPEPLTAKPRPDHIRPALSSDEIRLMPEAELERRGYGIRPEKDKDPKAYALWVEMTGRPVNVYKAEITDLKKKYLKHYPDHFVVKNSECTSSIMCPATSYNWSGFVVGPQSQLGVVSGRWDVPGAGVIPALGVYQEDESSTWVGIDGDKAFNSSLTDLAQGGTAQQVAYVFFNGSPSKPLETVVAWSELLPNQPSMAAISNFWMAPGDDVYVGVSILRDRRSGTTSLHFFIQDFTRSAETSVDTPLDGTQVPGLSAEWVMERPTQSNGQYTILPEYGNFNIAEASAQKAPRSGGLPVRVDFENSPGYNVTMTNAEDQVLSQVVDMGSATMQFTWVAPQ